MIKALAIIINLYPNAGGEIQEVRSQKLFLSYTECMDWKHRQEFQRPWPNSLVTWIYCEELSTTR